MTPESRTQTAPSFARAFRRWFLYERESHAKVLNALAAVPPDRREAPEFRKAVSLLAHIAEARRLWLFRLGGLPGGPGLEDMFPEGLTVDEVAERLEVMHRSWEQFLAHVDDERIAREFQYQSLEGELFRNTIVDILTQLYGHSLYHRGQIALLLRTMGAEPAVTDFVFWTREPVG